MKTIGILVAAIGVLSLALPSPSSAQRGMKCRGSGGWGPGSQYQRMYDTKTVDSINAVIVSMDSTLPMKGMSPGIHALVIVSNEEISVHLGPAWYLENQDADLKPGDSVRVIGSRITIEGKPAIIAAEIRKGKEVLGLRDKAGFPAWSGWRR
jgi:hypothetical protein